MTHALWISDSPTTPSGFGTVTRFICGGLADLGHRISILGWQTRGMPDTWHDCSLHPIRHHQFGADVLLHYLHRLQPDILITLADVWWLSFIASPVISRFMRTAQIPWALYYPIDGDCGDARLPASWVRALQTVDLPIAMSHYGLQITEANGVAAKYIPHGVDTTVFQPPSDRSAAKVALGYQDKFVVLSDARNQPRKMLPRTLEIFRRFAADKTDVLLHLHCDPGDPSARSPEYHYDLRADIDLLGLCNRVRITRGMDIASGIRIEELAQLYQASDVHLLASWGEGFGLPTLQAAAAGVVPMAADYTASRELVLGHGEPVRVQHFLVDQFGVRRALIDIEDAVARLDRLYRDRAALATQSEAAVRFAHPYDWKNVVGQWDDLLHRDVPRKRNNFRRPPVTKLVLRPRSDDMSPNITRSVRDAFSAIPDGAQITLSLVQAKAGELTTEIIQDAGRFENRLTVPVGLPPAEPGLVRQRSPSCVLIGGRADVSVVRSLARVFPGLNVWATVPVDLGPALITKVPLNAAIVPIETSTFRRQLAASVLAIDLEGRIPDLPAQTASLAVPCIGSIDTPGQSSFWPALTLQNSDGESVIELARRMLTDQGEAGNQCGEARRRYEATTPQVMSALV